MTDSKKPHGGPNSIMDNVQVSGVIKVFDKDGKLKTELDIVSLEINEDIENAVIDSTSKHTG